MSLESLPAVGRPSEVLRPIERFLLDKSRFDFNLTERYESTA